MTLLNAISLQTRRTTAVEPRYLKVKEYDISLTKNFCSNISIQNSSIYQFILKVRQILGSHVKLYRHAKNQLVPSVLS